MLRYVIVRQAKQSKAILGVMRELPFFEFRALFHLARISLQREHGFEILICFFSNKISCVNSASVS